jgi:hypothetical protein
MNSPNSITVADTKSITLIMAKGVDSGLLTIPCEKVIAMLNPQEEIAMI